MSARKHPVAWLVVGLGFLAGFAWLAYGLWGAVST